MESDSKQTTETERSEPHPGHVLLTAGIRRAVISTYEDYRRLLVSSPGVLLCIRFLLASLYLLE